MSDNTEHEEVLDPAEAAAEAEAAAAALAGYQARAKAPAFQPAAAVVAEESKPAQSGSDGADHAPAPAAAAQPPEVPNLLDDEPDDEADAPQTLEAANQRIKELKATVKSAEKAGSVEPDVIRKLYGEIGNMNRTIQQLAKAQPAPAAKPATAPVDDELTAAMKKAEEAAEAFPEVGGPLAEALKTVAARAAGQQALTAEQVSAIVKQETQAAATQALLEQHPDAGQIQETPAFQKWFSAQPAEYQQRLNDTWNPAVVAEGLTKFKNELKRQQEQRQKKQDRLAGAVTPPRGGAAKGGPSTLPDEEGFNVGYNKIRRLNSPNQFKR